MRVPVEAQTEAAHVLAAKIPDHIIGLFVEPVLLKGEDPKLYWNMVSATIDEHRPQSLLDWIELNDLATKLWEERVLRRATNAIIRGGQRRAVEQFLTEIRPGEDGLMSTANKAERRANKYFSASKNESDEIRSQLAEYGITEAELLARSAQNNSDAILMFEGMVSSRERSRRKLQKEIRTRRSSQEVKAQAPGNINADRQGSCHEVNTEANEDYGAHHHVHLQPPQEEAAPTDGVGFHHISQFGPCQEVTAQAKRDGSEHHSEQLRSSQEVRAKRGSEVDVHHHGH
ncbi:hypothetical protein QCM80_30630 [Bradyrhizobium sp. SSUT112]|uniref:hypothetical protein n=1 Tax=Bradyrhizobium sp. SSUT112 TaxID=3040604 RepID=UPI00244B5EEA|nr:hypothetical protein [Bradyrhizobium sp. SSUT112]MDH2354990.1 hypothetical protein [Bradyrhizobium sp. SSUT112]